MPNEIKLRMDRLELAAREIRPVNLRLMRDADDLIRYRVDRLEAAMNTDK